MEKLDMQSMNVTAANVEKIAALFPSCVTERLSNKGVQELAIDFDKLRMELGADVLDETEERYQFTWPDKREAIRLSNARTTMTLRPCREESVDFDNTENLYIEGDNLDVLKVLQQNYLGKVKMIYIDPPYNTGSDFLYKDKRVIDAEDYKANSGQFDEDGNQLVKNTESNGRFHTDWLNFMYPRLKVARNLLANDGAIFISIDDNEVENMRKICDEIFGERNFYVCFAWINSQKENIDDDTKFAGANLGKIKKSHEYVLVYKKKSYSINLDKGTSDYIDKLVTNGGNAITRCTIRSGIKCVSPITKTIKGHVGGVNDYYEILSPEGMIIENGILQNDVEIEGPLRNPETLRRFFNGERVIDKKGQEVIDVYLSETGMLNTRKLRAGDTPSTVLVGKGTTKNGTLDLKRLFGVKVFDFAKPTELLSYLIEKVDGEDFVVLDFFSGSGTTAHAVFIEKTLKKNVQFICVQLPEVIDPSKATTAPAKKIAEDAIIYLKELGLPTNICEIGKQRIRLAGNKIHEQNPNIDTGFRVLKLDESNMKDVYYTPSEVQEQDLWDSLSNIKEDRTPEDLLFQVMPECGVKFSEKIEVLEISGKKVFSVMDNYLAACFDENVNEEVITAIAKTCPTYFVMRDSSLESDNVADNFMQIFKQYSPETTCKII